MATSYPDNLTRGQFELLEPLLPAAKPGGRHREVDLWEVLNAIFYILTNGCKWRALPKDFPKWQTVYTYLRNWRQDGTWRRIHDQLREWTRVSELRAASPSELIIDSQSAKRVAMVSQAIGYDAGKQVKGRKRFITVDTLGLILRVLVTAANVPEREGAKQVLKQVKDMGEKVSRVHTVWADGGFSGFPFLQWVMDVCHWVLQVVLRPEQTKGFVLLKKRWVVERTFGWLGWCRRLNRSYEYLPETEETFIYLAMIRIMVRRLA